MDRKRGGAVISSPTCGEIPMNHAMWILDNNQDSISLNKYCL